MRPAHSLSLCDRLSRVLFLLHWVPCFCNCSTAASIALFCGSRIPSVFRAVLQTMPPFHNHVKGGATWAERNGRRAGGEGRERTERRRPMTTEGITQKGKGRGNGRRRTANIQRPTSNSQRLRGVGHLARRCESRLRRYSGSTARGEADYAQGELRGATTTGY